MKRIRNIGIWLLCAAMLALVFGVPAFSDEAHPIRLTVAAAPDTELSEGGEVAYLTFTIANGSAEAYTLHRARLSGGYDGVERSLDDEITVAAGSTKEFTLENVPVSDGQLGRDVVYTLTWDEVTTVEVPAPEPEEGEENPEGEPETVTTTQTTERSTTATIRIDRFVPPELTITVTAEKEYVQAGEPFTVTYGIANETKYDMSGVKLMDTGVHEGAIALPGTDLMAGASISVPVTYTMGEEDMTFAPVLTYVAARRQLRSECKEPVTVGAVVTGIQLDVQQYPANEEGTKFAITVTNTGNRAMRSLQLYDEIHSEIDKPFDLAPQQQKVLTFTVPSAYASGLVRTVRFHITGKDFFDNDFSYTDANSYDCVPYITSDAVRLSLRATVVNAYIDENGKLCGTIQVEIRNYSDVRVIDATLEELTLFGTAQRYEELQRGETYFVTTYQLDNVPTLTFRVTAKDTAGQSYQTDAISLNLDQLRAIATQTEEQTIIYYSNAFLKQLTDRIGATFRSVVLVILLLIGISGVICLVLWILERRIQSRLPRESILSIKVPSAVKPAAAGAIDRVLEGSPAEQLGYIAPAKIRYGASLLHRSEPEEESLGSILFAPLKAQREAQQPAPVPAPPAVSGETRAYRAPAKAAQKPEPKPAQKPVQKAVPAPVPPKAAAPQRMRVVEIEPRPKPRALRPNERIYVGKGK